jgi:formate hydrogenlyase subunit 3/multisubunit Na+/H+ antiporter MnhD subunit
VYARSYLRGDPRRHRFFRFYLVAMAGNFGLILAHDILVFAASFAVMSFSAYGLITHDRDAESRRAGLIYIVLVVLGELLVFVGFVFAAIEADSLLFEAVRVGIAHSPARALMVGLLLTGFGIKLGVVPLHSWLTLAHPVAPTPASAVLSGAMIKAGLIGWMRFLPLGETMMPGWGKACIILGFLTAFYGIAVGLVQTNPKTVLAYSSVSQMGLVVVALGSVLTQPAAWPTVSAALALFACHHAVSKGASFLGVGVAGGRFDAVWKRALVRAGLVVPALALAGAPFTLGGVAKLGLKQATTTDAMPWGSWSGVLLTASSLTTTMLMVHFLHLVWPRPRSARHEVSAGTWLPWSLLVAGVVAMIAVVHGSGVVQPAWFEISRSVLWNSVWPIATGAGLAALVLLNEPLRTRWSRLEVPAGDIVVPVTAAWLRLADAWHRGIAAAGERSASFLSWWRSAATAPHVTLPLSRVSAWLEDWGAVGIFVLLLTAALFALMRL